MRTKELMKEGFILLGCGSQLPEESNSVLQKMLKLELRFEPCEVFNAMPKAPSRRERQLPDLELADTLWPQAHVFRLPQHSTAMQLHTLCTILISGLGWLSLEISQCVLVLRV